MIVKLFLEDKRVDPSERGAWGESALTSACVRGHVKVLELLLADKRIVPSLKDDEIIKRVRYSSWQTLTFYNFFSSAVPRSMFSLLQLTLAFGQGSLVMTSLVFHDSVAVFKTSLMVWKKSRRGCCCTA